MKKLPLLLVVVIAAVSFLSCSKSNDQPALFTVQYKIASNANMNVSYTDNTGATATASNVSASWTYSFGISTHGQIVKLTITSVNGSPVSGQIFINNQQAVQNNDASGTVTMTAQIP